MKTILLITFLSIISLYSAEYHVDKNKKNSVKFISDAPIESFEGVTNKVDGYLICDPNDPTKNSELYFEVDLNSLDTGIGLRNRHMRENYLETDKHPQTHYTGKITSATKSGENWDVTVSGDFFVHGVKKKKEIKGKLIKTSGGFEIKTEFIVPLSEHKIDVPSLMFKKIDENMKIKVDFFLKTV